MIEIRVEIPVRDGPDAADTDASGDRMRRVLCDSSRGAQPGDTVLAEAPFAALLEPSLWATHCHACFRSAADVSTPLSRCGRCRAAYYCSRACQQRDWKPDHVVECSKLAALTALQLHSEQLSDVLMLGRALRRLAASPPNDDNDLSPLRLAWHDADCTKETELLAVLAQKLGFVAATATATSLQHLQRLVARFRSNNFAICDARLEPVGAGCFPLAAMVNHSCDPNAVITFDASTHRIVFRALRPIAKDDEITHAYVDMALPRRERLARLGRQYHFTCACARCVAPIYAIGSKDRYLDADIDGIEEAKWSAARRSQVGESLQLIAASTRSQSDDEAIGMLTKALAIQDASLHADNTQRLATLSALFTRQAQTPEFVEAAIRTGDEIHKAYERVYASNHPLVALHLFTLGDLCAAVGKREIATESYRSALAQLRVSHGEDHAFVAMVEQRLAEL